MIEKQKHLDAFEYFYTLGGSASKENCRQVAQKFQISERTFWNWYKKLGWKERTHLRDIDVAKKVEEKTTSTIADNKAKYLTFVHKIIDDLKNKFENGELPVEIKTVSDLDKAVKLGLLLQDEATEKTKTEHTGKVDGQVAVVDKITDPRDRAALTRIAEKYTEEKDESEPQPSRPSPSGD
jgi:hypothetical protein